MAERHSVSEPVEQKAEPTEQTEQTEAAPQTEQTEPADPVLVCYQELLKAAPAIEGEHSKLQLSVLSCGKW